MTTAFVKPESTAEFTYISVPEHDVEHPDAVVYSNTGASSAGWTCSVVAANGSGVTSASIAVSNTGAAPFRLNLKATIVTSVNPTFSLEARRTITGLVVGRSYTLSGVLAVESTGFRTRLRIGTDSTAWVAVTTETNVNVTFTASATSLDLYIELQDNPASSSVVGTGPWGIFADTIVLTENAWTEHVPDEYDTADLTISEGKITVADDWSPYIQATFDVPIADIDLAEQIDPKADQRVVVVAEEAIGGTSRTFDLALRARSIDHKDKKITIELASDEALLMDRKRVAATVDKTPRTHAASLRAVCNWALGKIGAALEAGTDDADISPYWPLTNFLTNPNVVATATGYLSGSASTTIAYNAGAGFSGTGFLRCTQTAVTGATYLAPGATSGFPVTARHTYTVASYLRVSTSTSIFQMQLRWFDENNVVISTSTSSGLSIGTSWTRHSFTAEAPVGAVKVVPFISVSATASGRTWDIDASVLVEDDEVPAYFDGASTLTGYTLAWSGTANASQSTRTPLVDRPRELLYWSPGKSLWDFLTPLLESAGLRLFCDETRDWRLVDPATYEVPGYVTVQEKHNPTRGTDNITRNDDSWADAVVCIYRWTDDFGVQREAYDFAGDPDGKCITLTYDREFPGPGAAAYALGRFQGTGRTQDVTCLTTYDATPGQDVTITLPGTLPQTGKVREVIFDLKTGLMDLGTRGLIDALPGSWALWNPTQTWSAVSGTLNWNDL